MTTIFMWCSRHLVGILFSPGCFKKYVRSYGYAHIFFIARSKNTFDLPLNAWSIRHPVINRKIQGKNM